MHMVSASTSLTRGISDVDEESMHLLAIYNRIRSSDTVYKLTCQFNNVLYQMVKQMCDIAGAHQSIDWFL